MNVSSTKPAAGEALEMSEASEPTFAGLYREGACGNPSSWLGRLQSQGWERYKSLGLPERKLEDWHYTNLRPLARTAFRWPGLTASPASLASYRQEGSLQLVFNNGRFDPQASDSLAGLPAGVVVGNLGDASLPGREEWVGRLRSQGEAMDDHGMAALGDALMGDGAFIFIPAGERACPPLHLLHVTTVPCQEGEPLGLSLAGPASFLRHFIVLEAGAELQLTETYTDADQAFLKSSSRDGNHEAAQASVTNIVTDALLGHAAKLVHYRIQAEGQGAYHLAQARLAQEEASVYEAFTLSIGSQLARISTIVQQLGPDAMTLLQGLYLGRGTQHTEQHTRIDHCAPRGKSRQYFKGMADHKAKAVFVGQVKVAQEAQKIAAQQLNKNLLLSAEADIATKPVLEIDADDVKCSHGATVSQLREEEFFYLASRGIGRPKAKALLSRAFADELLYGLEDSQAAAYLQRFLSGYFHSPLRGHHD